MPSGEHPFDEEIILNKNKNNCFCNCQKSNNEEDPEDKTETLKEGTTKLQKRLGEGVWVDSRSIVKYSEIRGFFGAVSQMNDVNGMNDVSQSQLGKEIRRICECCWIRHKREN